MVKDIRHLAVTLFNRGCENPWFYKECAVHGRRYDYFLENIAKELEICNTVIDVGSGLCIIPILIALSFPDIKITAIDKNVLMTAERVLHLFLPGISDRITLRKDNATEYQGRYDGVICTEVLEHNEDPTGIFKNLWSMAQKWVFISVPSEHSGYCPGHLRVYTKEM